MESFLCDDKTRKIYIYLEISLVFLVCKISIKYRKLLMDMLMNMGFSEKEILLMWWALHCGETSLVGSCVSGAELLGHCSVARVDSLREPVAGGEGSHWAVLLWTSQREPLQSPMRTNSCPDQE